MSSSQSSRARVATLAIVLAALMAPLLWPASAEALPAFARKHDLSCTACHTKPPRLNDFGEAFHMAGFRIPAVNDGERHRKRQIGRIWSETDLLNSLSVRARGDILAGTDGAAAGDDALDIASLRSAELYLTGTLTDDISYFFTFEGDEEEFGIGHEFFVLANLEALWRRGGGHGGHGGGPMVMGPMIMAGKIDPSTNFSYPTNRQLIENIGGSTAGGTTTRFALRPYAFAAKFFGVETLDGRPLEVTEPVLYNTDGDTGIDTHLMIGRFLLQAGILQGAATGDRDANRKKDPYLMARMNFGGRRYVSGSVSALVQRGFETAQVGGLPIDWLRTGLAANLRWRHFDVYGAVIRDQLRELPDGIAPFDDRALGVTVQADWLATDAWLWSLRYDRLDAGGFIDQRADGSVLSLQGRYYLRDNLSLWLRDSYNAGDVSANPLQNFRHLFTAGLDLVF